MEEFGNHDNPNIILIFLITWMQVLTKTTDSKDLAFSKRENKNVKIHHKFAKPLCGADDCHDFDRCEGISLVM